jgi:TonB family protein
MILKLTALLLLACGADLALRRAPAALRHLMWTLALINALLLPVFGLYAPKVAGGAFMIHTSAAVAAAAFATPTKFNWVVAIYLAGVVILLARLGLDILSANRIVKQARPSSLPGVLISEDATVPFVWGPIVVPPGFENRTAVLAHEASHVERGDIWTSLLARVTCAIYWFHPLVWWAGSRMRLEADRACDDAVLRQGFADTGYAEDLVEVARSFTSIRLAPGAVKQSQLESRVRHILTTGVNRRKLGVAAACVTILGCLSVFAPLAAISRASPDVYKVGKGVLAPRVLSKVDPRYTAEAIAAKTTGSVLLAITVGSDGLARDIEVKHKLDPGLDENAISAVRHWRFQPGTKDGKAVNVRAAIEINYRLK